MAIVPLQKPCNYSIQNSYYLYDLFGSIVKEIRVFPDIYMKRLFFFIVIYCISQDIYSQMALGLVNGNYAGSRGAIINPSSMANSQLKLDINLLSVNAFVENNYLYFPSRESSIIKLFNGVYDFHFFPKPYGYGERRVYSYFQDKSDKNIFVNARIMGPSVMFSYKDNVFAIRTGFRVMSSTRRLPYDLANFSYYGLDFTPQHNVDYERNNFDIAAMAWWELSLSYATVLKRSSRSLWSAGISVGPVFGNSGAYMSGNHVQYIAYNDSVLNIEMLNAEIGVCLPMDYDDNDVDITNSMIRGTGWGMDIGFTWQFRKKPYQRKPIDDFYKKRFEGYKLKIGVSVLDIGWINYTKNAEMHRFDNVHNNSIIVNELNYNNLAEELKVISNLFYEDSNASYRENSFKMYLPACLSVQIDYHLTDWWYLNSTMMVPLVYKSPMIERPVVFSVTPRFESRFLEFNIPVVLYDFKDPRIGFSVRLEGLTVGTDHLGCFFSSKDFTGADIYVSYKINIGNESKNSLRSEGACFNNWR